MNKGSADLPVALRMSLPLLRHRHLRVLVACLGVVLVIHMYYLRRRNVFVNDPRRLFATCVYFGALIWICLELLLSHDGYLKQAFERRYRNWPAAIQTAARKYVYHQSLAVYSLAAVSLLFIASTAVATLQLWGYWLTPLASLSPWGQLASLLLFVFWTIPLIKQRNGFSRTLDLAVKTLPDDLKAPTADELSETVDEAAVRVIRPGVFRAGGTEFVWKDFNDNAIVFGQAGSGKTGCVLNALLEGIMKSGSDSGLPIGALILDPKGDFREKIQVLCEMMQRSSDLYILDPLHPDQSTFHWNPMDTTDDQQELAARFTSVMETLGMEDSKSSFWIDSTRQFLANAIDLLRLTNAQGQPPNLVQIYKLATGFAFLSERVRQLNVNDARCDRCLNYFAEEWCEMPNEQRVGVQSYLTNMLNPFLLEPYNEMFSQSSQPTIADIVAHGKILYFALPVAEKPRMARTIGTFLKLQYFREVQRQLPTKQHPSLFFCDEFQKFFTTGQGTGDADYFEILRQSKHANLVAVQNLSSFRVASQEEKVVSNLIGNCATKIFLRNGHPETNRFASELWGRQDLDVINTSIPVGRWISADSPGTTTQSIPVIEPERFSSLAIPSKPQARDFCESYIWFGARPDKVRSLQAFRWKFHELLPEPARLAAYQTDSDGNDLDLLFAIRQYR